MEVSRECLSCGAALPPAPDQRDLECAIRVLERLSSEEGSATARALVQCVVGGLKDILVDYEPILRVTRQQVAAPQQQVAAPLQDSAAVGERVPSWRLCKVGLPDDDREVALLIKGGYAVRGYRCSGHWYDGFDRRLALGITVIAWMDVDCLNDFDELEEAIAEDIRRELAAPPRLDAGDVVGRGCLSPWVRVSDSLPDDETTVMALMDDGEMWPAYVDGGEWYYASGDKMGFHVTHWMDLPAMPPGAAGPFDASAGVETALNDKEAA